MQSIHSLSMQLNQNEPDNQQPAGAASSSGQRLSRLFGKKAARLKELMLQNLGRADKTTDELFEMYEENFYKQQAQAVKLAKEFRLYASALRTSHEAGKQLNACIQQSTSDYQSARHDLVCENLSHLEHLSDDLMEKIREQVLANLDEYLTQFSELRDKIAKRRRKIIDYDSSRRVYELMLANINKKRLRQQQPRQSQGLRSLRSAFMSSSQLNQQQADGSLQSATSQLLDEARLLKLREQFNYSKLMYQTINSELHEELPLVYEKKMKHLLMTLRNYFSLEAQFSSNAGKLYATISDVVDELPMSMVQHSHIPHLVSANSAASDHYHQKALASGSSGMGSSRGESSLESSSSPDISANGSPVCDDESQPPVELHEQPEEPLDGQGEQKAEVVVDGQQEELEAPGAALEAVEMEQQPPREADGAELDSQAAAAPAEEQQADCEAAEVELEAVTKQVEEPICKPIDDLAESIQALTCNKSEHNCLYKVKTSYKYLAEDVDELCFEADELIQVVDFDESYEPEDGWLMGIREVNGQKGLFPANFTRPI